MECFLLCGFRVLAVDSGVAKVSLGDGAPDSETGLVKLCCDDRFSHSPSFSIRLLISTEDLERDFISASSAMLGGVNATRDGGLGTPKLNIELMLLLTECPRTVCREPSVSEEIVESGLGMTST